MEGRQAQLFARIAYVYVHLLLAAGIVLVATGLKVFMEDVQTPVTPPRVGIPACTRPLRD